MSNFIFLSDKWPILYNLGRLAEKNVYSDPNTTLMKVGMFGETLVKYMVSMEGIKECDDPISNTNMARIRLLKSEDLIPSDIENIIHILRKTRNDAAHEIYEDIEVAKEHTRLAHKLGVWFMQTYGDWDFEPQDYQEPIESEYTVGASTEEITKEYEEKLQQLEAELRELRDKEQTKEDVDRRREQGKRSAKKIILTEAETRELIDQQLKEVGWEADTKSLSYGKGARPQKNKNLAIAEWPTYSAEKGNGRVDYALFIGLKLVGFIEVKKYNVDVMSNIEESKTYAKGVKEEHTEYVVSQWNHYRVPFLFAGNGRKYMKEVESKSGVWFLDCRENTNHPKVLRGWYSPEKLQSLLESDEASSNKSLDELDFEFLKDSNSIGLRDYQADAIKAVEKAIREDRKSALITMATGTGKTRTVLGLIYRLLKTKRFKRILFLVDRTSLGTQALDTFKEVKLEDLKTLDKIYNINGLGDKTISKETKIHIATVQAMVKRLLYTEYPKEALSVGDYDCIVVDEAHRGYLLDKEMSYEEVEFKDNEDFLSKYKMVIDYFDAFKVALTATPALHTTNIFGPAVYNYTYRQAVIDGYLVDHEPPHNILTSLTKEGINLKKGEQVAEFDNVTGELKNGEALKDDMEFDVEQFNKKIINKPTIREALKQIAERIHPDVNEGKTLIFAVNNTHADNIVAILKDIYSEMPGGIDDDAILKITGDIKDPELAIKKFKNERYPNIVVTVDLLTTGIDVPEINKLVFMRRIKSRILYEQMLGRATRLCDKIGKTHFEIFDCVLLYEALKDVTNMKPVVATVNTSFKGFKEDMDQAPSIAYKENVLNKAIAKLQRKKKLIKANEIEVFKGITKGSTPETFIKQLKEKPLEEAIKLLFENEKLISYLDEKGDTESKVIITNREDRVISETRGYGKGKRPEDYLEEFKRYIEENKNTVLALEIVCTRPQDLSRAELKQLKAILDNEGFSEEYLKTAFKDIRHEEIAADIIAFVRQQAIGSALMSTEERLEKAFSKIQNQYKFTTLQQKWLDRIKAVMLKETIIDRETFNQGNLKREGGFNRFNKIFDEQLEQMLTEIKTYMFDDKEIS